MSLRVNIAKDKADLVRALTVMDGKSGPFQTYADVIAFAATLGLKRQKRIPIREISKREPGAIDLDIFISRGYEMAIKLMGMTEENSPQFSSHHHSEIEELRLQIFAEYANGGLEIMREEFRGTVDYLEQLLLLLSKERSAQNQLNLEFDLTKFLS